jgi:hypothetical protein
MSKITFAYDLEINAGASLSDSLLWKIDSVPVDLTGASARAQLRRTHSSTGIVAEFSTANNKLALGGAEGTIAFKAAPADTQGLSGEGVYDLEITFADGSVTRLFEGTFVVHPEVTR